MKKRVIALTLAVVLLLSISVAAVTNTDIIAPLLQFDGKTAHCYVEASADHPTDLITITASLWRGSTCLATWTTSGRGIVFLDESTDVSVTGVTYRLTADVTIAGRTIPQVETTAKCPFN